MKTDICDRCKKPIPPLNHYSYCDITKIAIDYVLPNPYRPYSQVILKRETSIYVLIVQKN